MMMRADPRYFTADTTPERQLISAFLLRAWADLDHPNRFVVNDAYYWITELKKKLTRLGALAGHAKSWGFVPQKQGNLCFLAPSFSAF